MPDKADLTEAELRLIIRKVKPVKAAGHGEVLIQIQDGSIVFIKQSIGEKVKANAVK
jgi:hypothetical protein